jgi:DNA-binding winged helix-turn-helix (wHTH) protein
MASVPHRFAGFRLDPVARVVERDGRPVSLTAKALDLLLALVDRRGRVVTKQELMAIVWPDTAVEENNLTVTMSALRKALGEANSPPIIA